MEDSLVIEQQKSTVKSIHKELISYCNDKTTKYLTFSKSVWNSLYRLKMNQDLEPLFTTTLYTCRDKPPVNIFQNTFLLRLLYPDNLSTLSSCLDTLWIWVDSGLRVYACRSWLRSLMSRLDFKFIRSVSLYTFLNCFPGIFL